jgi:hypothetical protein
MSFFDQVCEGDVRTPQAEGKQELTAKAAIFRTPGKSQKVIK